MAPSPFNPLKLELAAILVIGFLVLLLSARLENGLAPLLLVFGYGTAAMLWLLVRTRAVLKRALRTGASDGRPRG